MFKIPCDRVPLTEKERITEQEEGYVIVVSEDIDVEPFLEMLDGFSVNVRGSATIASVHQLN